MMKIYFIALVLTVFLGTAVAADPITREIQVSGAEVYNLSLEEATRLALFNNFDIQLARYDALISRAAQGKAESLYDTLLRGDAGYRDNQRAQASTILGTQITTNEYNFGLTKKFPAGTSLDLDLMNARTASNSAFTTSPVTHESSGQVRVTQALGRNFFGVADRGEIKAVLLRIDQAEYTSLEKIQEYLGQVQSSYWRLAQAARALEFEREVLEQSLELWKFNQQQIKNGLIEKADLLASEASYQQHLNDWLLAGNRLEQSENHLRLMLNISDDHVRLNPVDAFVLPDSDESPETSLKLAFAHRQDYHRQKIEIEARQIELEVTANQLWPEINLQASFARNGLGSQFQQSLNNIFEQDNPEVFVGLNFSVPLENTKARAEKREADLQVARAIVALKYLERKIAVGVVDQVRLCNVLRQTAGNAQKTARLQQEKLLDEKKRFEQGRSNTDTIVRFRRDLSLARRAALASLQEYIDAAIELRAREGMLLKIYQDGD
jgi:outer membrane protein TolC